jgi:hypothetical protein
MKLYAFLTSTQDGCEKVVSRIGHFIVGQRDVDSHWIEVGGALNVVWSLYENGK